MPASATDESQARRGVPPWLVATLLFVVAFAVYAPTIAHASVSLDVWSANYGSWHLATAGTPWIEGLRIPVLDHNPLRSVWVLDAANGHTVIGRSPGVIAVALPAYWISQPSAMTTVPGGLTAALLTASSVTLVFLALRHRLPSRTALLVTVVFAFATPVWSVAANGVWPHTVTVFGIAGMAWAASTNRWWLAGVFGGITLWGRLHAAFIVALFGLLVGFRRREPSIVVKVGIGSAAFLVLMSAWTRWMYGTWNPTGSYDTGPFATYAEDHRFSVTNQLGFWISPDRGILVWTPILLVLLPALVRSWRDLPDWSRSLLWGGLAYTVLQAVLSRFSGGDNFYGYRLGLEFLAGATPAFGLSIPRAGRWARSLAVPVLIVQFFAVALGSVSDGHYITSEEVWHRNAFVSAMNAAGPAAWGFLGALVLISIGASFAHSRRHPPEQA